MVGVSRRLFAVLGDPVRHSLSPLMHNAALAACGLSAAYSAIRCGPRELPPLIARLADAGGGGNVTVPHKQAALAAGIAEPEAQRLGACNTFWADRGSVRLANTDVTGVIQAVRALGVDGGAWLVVGTGGSARAVAGAAAELGASLRVSSRSPGRAEDFARWAASIGVPAAGVRARCTLVLNATPLGLTEHDPFPTPVTEIPAGAAVLDLVYGRGGTAWVRAARARGLAAEDGRGALVAQGAASFALWWPGVEPPAAVMREVVDGALG